MSATKLNNFDKIYNEVYESLVECDVTSKIDNPVYMDCLGNPTVKSEGLWCKYTYRIVHPDMCLVVDKVGSKLSEKGDGHIRGQKFVCGMSTIP